MSFFSDLKRFAKKTDAKVENMVVGVFFDLNKAVVMETPVKDGGARGGWVASLNRPLYTQGIKDKGGDRTRAKADAVAKNAIGNIYYLSNSVEYIGMLEFGGYGDGPKTVNGYSKLAPHGMARIAMDEAKRKLKVALS